MLPPDQETLQPGQVVLRAYLGSQGLEMRPSEIQRLTLELTDLPTWTAGIKELPSLPDLGQRPWSYFAHESKVWA